MLVRNQGKRSSLYTVGGNVFLFYILMQPVWKAVWRFLKKLKIEP
jgi:hypothetical protein